MGEKPGFFGRLRERLGKTRTNLVDGVRNVLGTRPKLDAETIEDLEAILIQADIGVDTTLNILDRMREAAREKKLASTEDILAALKDILIEIIEPGDHTVAWKTDTPPHVTLITGVNGSGKTTTIGKLASKLKAEGKTVLIGAADTFRAAASDQLEVWCDRAGVPIVKLHEGADPAAVAHDAVQAGVSRKMDCVIIDTAGRLHTKVNLMEELKKLQRVVSRLHPGAPHEVLLVLDATTGQNGLQQARKFTQTMAVTGIVLTKLDGTAKGGIVVAIQKELGIPIKYIGVGEGIEDLQPFRAREFVEALFS
jgi:fused signal recognition particle receptor